MASSPTQSSSSPFVLFLCHPLTGHLTPTLRVASTLHDRGWTTFFLGPTSHKPRIAASGATFLPLKGCADLDDLLYYSADNPAPPTPDYASLNWRKRALLDLQAQCFDVLPTQWRCVVDALVHLHSLDAGRGVVVVCEAFFHGILPLFGNAPLPEGIPRPLRTICLSVTPPLIRSRDLPPFGMILEGFEDDVSAFGHDKVRNSRCWEMWTRKTRTLKNLLDEQLQEAGVQDVALIDHGDDSLLSGANYTCHSSILQIGVPGFEFRRSDWPSNFHFVGFLPVASQTTLSQSFRPVWWDEIVESTGKKKKIVIVAQGTVECDPTDLIVPTIRALAHRSDVIVVAILGRKGASLSSTLFVSLSDTETENVESTPSQNAATTLTDGIPNNVRVADYLSYEAVLPYADVWVHNAGYGAVNHGIVHGVPMVVAGEGQDKMENARRVAYSGVGISMCTNRPTVDKLRGALQKILDDTEGYRFKQRTLELKAEGERLDCFHRIESAVMGQQQP